MQIKWHDQWYLDCVDSMKNSDAGTHQDTLDQGNNIFATIVVVSFFVPQLCLKPCSAFPQGCQIGFVIVLEYQKQFCVSF